jgi:hypothetical protein
VSWKKEGEKVLEQPKLAFKNEAIKVGMGKN